MPLLIKMLAYYALGCRFVRNPKDLRDFLWVSRQVRANTLVVPSSLAALYRLTKELDRRGVEGDLVECGTWNGGSAAVIARAARLGAKPIRELWLFDSFQGLPSVTQEDGDAARAHVGTLVADRTKVKEILDRVGTPSDRVHVVPGWFRETFRTAPIENIALLHIDADWYESVKLSLEYFYDKVSPNGAIVLNDYGAWQGAKRAVDEFIDQRGLSIALRWVDPGTRYFLKPCY
jgi:O-methyltransferase